MQSSQFSSAHSLSSFAKAASRIPRASPCLTRSLSTVSRPYRFHTGASWAGKPSDPLTRPVNTAPFARDHPIGRWRDHVLSRPNPHWGKHIGEDFFYIQEMRSQSGVSLGIADGVGGWVDAGVDPSLFSQSLMFHAHRYAKAGWPGEPEIDPTQDYEEREKVEGWELRPSECLELAYGAVLRERNVLAGSSTACIAHLNAYSGVLRAANLGDSGFCVIRSSSVIHWQTPQTHFFNCPKQLTKLPVSSNRFRSACVDAPSDADLYETRLRDGDIVVLFTDGMSDNVFPAELVSICSLVARQFAHAPPKRKNATGQTQDNELVKTEEDAQVQTIAERIVDYARLCMLNKKRVSPFERAAAREGMYFRGGKLDDVTVVVALVRETI